MKTNTPFKPLLIKELTHFLLTFTYKFQLIIVQFKAKINANCPPDAQKCPLLILGYFGTPTLPIVKIKGGLKAFKRYRALLNSAFFSPPKNIAPGRVVQNG